MFRLFLTSLLMLPTMSFASPLKVEAEDAADHHVSAQGNYKGGLGNSWEWRLGSRRSSKNITGISAHGLLAVHRLTGLDEHQKSALRAAKSLIRAYDKGWKHRRPHTQDIEFLAAAGFIIDAGRWFGVVTTRYPAHVYVDRVIRARARLPGVAGWDVASAIRAALAVGRPDYARSLLAELMKRRGDWDKPATGQQLAHASLLWSLADLRDRGGLTHGQQQLASSLYKKVVGKQKANGAWQTGSVYCTQTTAYAILALSRFKEGKSAAARGRRWLIRSALTDKRFFHGGRIWATTYLRSGRPENNFNSEIQSEAMMALASGR